MGGCPTPIGLLLNKNTGELSKLNCKQWDCPHCSVIRVKGLKFRIRLGMAGFRVRHLVFTELKAAGSKHEDIMLHWARLRTWMWDKGYKGNRFFWAIEFKARQCKSCRNSSCIHCGEKHDCYVDNTLYRHLHVAISLWCPISIIEDGWEQATEGTAKIVREDRLKGQMDVNEGGRISFISNYLTKYLTKGFTEAPFSEHEHRYGFSQHFPVQTKNSLVGEWEFIPGASPDDEIYSEGDVCFYNFMNIPFNPDYYANGWAKPSQYRGLSDTDIEQMKYYDDYLLPERVLRYNCTTGRFYTQKPKLIKAKKEHTFTVFEGEGNWYDETEEQRHIEEVRESENRRQEEDEIASRLENSRYSKSGEEWYEKIERDLLDWTSIDDGSLTKSEKEQERRIAWKKLVTQW